MPKDPKVLEKQFRAQQEDVNRLAKLHLIYIDQLKQNAVDIRALEYAETLNVEALKETNQRHEGIWNKVDGASKQLDKAITKLNKTMADLGKGEDDERMMAAKVLIKTCKDQIATAQSSKSS